MPRAIWPLLHGRPRIEVVLNTAATGLPSGRDLVADSGAGSMHSPFELLLSEHDCISCGGFLLTMVPLSGAYSGRYPLYRVRIQVPQVGFDRDLHVVGIPTPPAGFDGRAGFRLLNRFTYGNFGDPDQFGIES